MCPCMSALQSCWQLGIPSSGHCWIPFASQVHASSCVPSQSVIVCLQSPEHVPFVGHAGRRLVSVFPPQSRVANARTQGTRTAKVRASMPRLSQRVCRMEPANLQPIDEGHDTSWHTSASRMSLPKDVRRREREHERSDRQEQELREQVVAPLEHREVHARDGEPVGGDGEEAHVHDAGRDAEQ